MSIFLPRRKVAAAVSVALLLGACSSSPQRTTPDTTAAPESNEPDLVAQLRERMAAGNLQQRKARPSDAGAGAVAADTSSAPKATPIDPVKQQAAMAAAPEYFRALTLMKAGNDAEALALMQGIAAKSPALAGPRLNQAVILMRQDKFAEAEAAVREALKANPKSPYAQNLLGIALREQGKFPEARAAYEAALALDPNYAKAHFNLGVLLDMYMQDLPAALDHYTRYQALQSKPDTAVANWIIDLQKRTGVYKAPPRPAEPAPAADDTTEEEAPATAAAPAPAGSAPAAPPATAPVPAAPAPAAVAPTPEKGA